MADLETAELDVNTPIGQSDEVLNGIQASPYFEDYLFRLLTDLNSINDELVALNEQVIALFTELAVEANGIRIVNDLEIDGDLNHDGSAVGFYGTTPVSQQTGVAVSDAAIHAALVNLGLITA